MSTAPRDAEEIWTDFYPNIRRYVMHRMPSSHDGDDVLQATFEALLNNFEKFEDIDNVKGWLMTVARNKTIDFFRSNQTRRVREHDAAKEQPAIEKEYEETSAAGHCLEAILEFMPEKYGLAVKLVDIQDYTFSELSEQLDISIPGAKSRVQRGRKMLREMLEECCELEFDSGGNVTDSEHRTHVCRFCSLTCGMD